MSEQNKSSPGQDKPLVKAAMAAIGVVSGAVEKAAGALGELSSKDSIDRMARKGEEVFEQVKGFGARAFKKVKEALDDPLGTDSLTLEAAKEALGNALGTIARTAQEAQKAVLDAVKGEDLRAWADQLDRELKHQRDQVAALLSRLRAAGGQGADAEDDPAASPDAGQPLEGEIPYQTNRPPLREDEKVEDAPVDEAMASPTAASDEDNINKLKATQMNDHIPQAVPPER